MKTPAVRKFAVLHSFMNAETTSREDEPDWSSSESSQVDSSTIGHYDHRIVGLQEYLPCEDYVSDTRLGDRTSFTFIL